VHRISLLISTKLFKKISYKISEEGINPLKQILGTLLYVRSLETV